MQTIEAVPPLVAQPSPLALNELDESTACANCGAERIGDFCHGCGQHHLEGGRLTMRHLWNELALRFLRIERGLLYTVGQLCVRPGIVARRYVQGERRRFINPLTYFFIACTIGVIGYELIEDRMVNLMATGLDEQSGGGTAESMAKVFPGAEDPTRAYASAMFDIIQRTYSYLQFFLALPLAFCLRLFFQRRGERYNLAEVLVLALYMVAQFTIISTLIQPLSIIADNYMLTGILAMMIGLVLVVWGAMQFFKRYTVEGALLATLSFVLAYMAYFVVILFVILGTIIWRVYQAHQAGLI